MKSLLPTEHEIQNQCISYLYMRGFYVQRLNSGKIPMTYRGQNRMIQMVAVGTPDIMAFKRTRESVVLYFFEIKRPGNKPTYLQTQKMQELEQFGARCFVIHSLEELTQVV